MWAKRITYSFKCPSGIVAQIRRPGPSLALKCTKVVRIFEPGGEKVTKDVDAQLAFLEGLSDAEVAELYDFARVMLADVVAEPRLFLNPVGEQLSPDDLPPADFWAIFICASNGIRELPVKMKDGETTVDAVENFPATEAGSVEPDSDSPIVQ